MREKELKSAILDIEIPREMEQRLLNNCKEKQRRPVFNYRRPVWAAAACILVFVMLFGYPYLAKSPGSGNIELKMGESPLVIKAYASSPNGEIVYEDMNTGTEILMGRYSMGISSVPGFPFQFSYPGTTIELTVDKGELILWNRSPGGGYIETAGNPHNISEQGTVYWRPIMRDSTTNEYLPGLADSAIIDYKITKKGHIIGIGMIKIDTTNPEAGAYSAKLILSTGFPKVDGKYQRVTEQDIQRIREEALKEHDAD